MGVGIYKAVPMTMGATSMSASVDLGRGFSSVYLVMPSMVSSSALDLYAAVSASSTYYQVRKAPDASTATVLAPSFIIAASANANGGIIPLPGGFQFYKIIATDSAPTAALGFNVICGDN